ncbi:anti-sigma factor family protein [Gluconobacter sphaericus]|uniref:anti-sigma factor family protein n=1 Tax=Gluconobacter sphaericus TaxID=574987 RepID=UPI001B8CFD84|nr:anti-sigma factor [Gluconobacter sphaericus]MBS1086397.1 anti-sigma factor [Gluconobacter sphaericus]MBS1100639.1 anti-sigma factor [Gluconobacter sphaericus]
MTRSAPPVTEDDLHAWVDELLSPERLRTVERWLDENPAVQQRVMTWRKERILLRAALNTDFEQYPPVHLDITRPNQLRIRYFSISQMAASVVLALSIGLGGGWFLREREVPLGLASVEQEAMIVHVSGTDSIIAEGNVAQLTAWGTQTSGRLVRAPDLSAAGYHFLTGQLVTTDHGPACVFLYKDKHGTRISLFIRPMHGRDMTAPMRAMRDIPGYIWAQDGLGVSMISDESVLGLHSLANQARDLMAQRHSSL